MSDVELVAIRRLNNLGMHFAFLWLLKTAMQK